MSASSVSGSSPPLPESPSVPPAPALPGAAAPTHDIAMLIKDLRTYFFTYDGVVRALDGVSLAIRRGETTGLVGETGCGKSVTAFSVTRLIPDPPGRIVEGQVIFRGMDLLAGIEGEARFASVPNSPRVKVRRSFRRIKASTERMSAIRGNGISMIFQEPSQAMNPIMSVGAQIAEVLLLRRGPEIIDEFCAATPDAPGVSAAIQSLVSAAGEDRREAIREAAARLGREVGLASFATEAFYLAREQSRHPVDLETEILRAMGRFRLSSTQRSYLANRRRQMLLQRRLCAIYLEEIRAAGAHRSGRTLIAALRGWERLRHFYFGLWGIRSRMQRPLEQELFWRTVGQLEGVAIANPVQVARGYPHELSGGMLQRAMIAMALSSEPDVLLADEPTTALDVTIQAQILQLMRDLKERVGTAILLITHDLAVIAEVADRVCVMYAGQIVENAPVRELFRRPLHPYSQGLLASIPRLDQPDKKLSSIPGSVPNLITPPTGCRFHPRCPYAMPICKESRPPMTVEGPDHTVACFLYKGPVEPE